MSLLLLFIKNIKFFIKFNKVIISKILGRHGVWRLPNTRFRDDHVVPLRRSGRKSQNYYGWISYYGAGKLVRVGKRLTGVRYASILDRFFYPEIERLFPGGADVKVYVVEDNSRVHTRYKLIPWSPR